MGRLHTTVPGVLDTVIPAFNEQVCTLQRSSSVVVGQPCLAYVAFAFVTLRDI